MKKLLVVLFVVAFSLMPILAQADSPHNLSDGCVENFDPGADYFPDHIQVQYAKNFNVTYFKNYKLVTTLPWPNAEQPLQYVLVQCGTPAPDGYAPHQIIEVPVQRFVSMTTSVLPYLDEQHVLDRLVGVDTALFVNNETVLGKVASGDVVEVGGGGSGGDINLEVLIGLQPDLVMAQEFSPGAATLNQLQSAGLRAVLNADYTDTSPLGQAEWGKYIALFFNTEAEATRAFAGVAERYNALKALTTDVTQRPTVLAASPYDDVWYMPGLASTVAQLLEDAGGDFLWKDEPGTSVPLDFEVVLDRGAGADFWVNVNQFWNNTDDLLADDARFGEFQPFQNGNLWNNNARMNANGGNDYFESGTANPDVLLADLIKILHPELLPDYQIVYYRQLTSMN